MFVDVFFHVSQTAVILCNVHVFYTVHYLQAVWPDLAIYWTLGIFLKPLATIDLPKSSTFLGNFCKGVKIIHFSIEITFRQLLYIYTVKDFYMKLPFHIKSGSNLLYSKPILCIKVKKRRISWNLNLNNEALMSILMCHWHLYVCRYTHITN